MGVVWNAALCSWPMHAHPGAKEFKAIHRFHVRTPWNPQRMPLQVHHWKIYDIYYTPLVLWIVMNTPKAQQGMCLFTFLLDKARSPLYATLLLSDEARSSCITQLLHVSNTLLRFATCAVVSVRIVWNVRVIERDGREETVAHSHRAQHFSPKKLQTPNSWLGRKVRTKFPRCLSVSTQSDLFCQHWGAGALSLSLPTCSYFRPFFFGLYYFLLVVL